jgi:hypothetical protein
VGQVAQVGRVGKNILYFGGRGVQLIGMWLLLVDLFTAGPLGPDPKLFAAGVVAFLVGWALTSVFKQT